MVDQNQEQISANIKSVYALLAVRRATELAQRGRLDDAGDFLESFEGTSAAVADLLARIRAQQGDLLAAEKQWNLVLKLQPNHLGARQGLDKIMALNRRRHSRLSALAFFAGRTGSAIVVAVLAIALIGLYRGISRPGSEHVLPTPAAGSADHAAAAPGPEQPPEQDPNRPSDSAPADSLKRELGSLAGLNVSLLNEAVAVEFQGGLFGHGVTFRPERLRSLEAVARSLKEYPGIRVTLTGCTDPRKLVAGSPYVSNERLALLRAWAVFEIIRRESQLSEDVFTFKTGLVSPDQGGDQRTDLAELRTVRLRIEFRDGHRSEAVGI